MCIFFSLCLALVSLARHSFTHLLALEFMFMVFLLAFFDIDFAIFVFMATFAVGRVHLIRNFTIDIKHVPYIYIVYYMLLY